MSIRTFVTTTETRGAPLLPLRFTAAFVLALVCALPGCKSEASRAPAGTGAQPPAVFEQLPADLSVAIQRIAVASPGPVVVLDASSRASEPRLLE
jgi:hypothetical protein